MIFDRKEKNEHKHLTKSPILTFTTIQRRRKEFEGEKEERERHQQEEQKSAILLKAALFYICKEKIELNNRKKGR